MPRILKILYILFIALYVNCAIADTTSEYQNRGRGSYAPYTGSTMVKYPDKPEPKAKIQLVELHKTEDFARRNYNEAIELSALNKIALVSGKSSREYLMALVKFKLKQGANGRDDALNAINKMCASNAKSYECLQSKALFDVSSSQMKMKLQNFTMHEEHKDYQAAVDAMNDILGIPFEHNLRYRYYSLMGNIEGRENEAVDGLEKILRETPYESAFTREIERTQLVFRAQGLANKAIREIDDPFKAKVAQQSLEKALSLDPNNSDADYWREIISYSKYYRTVEEADNYLAKADYKKAEASYKNAANYDKNSPYAYMGLARAYALENDLDNFDKYAKLAISNSKKESVEEQQRIKESLQAIKAGIYSEQALAFDQKGEYNDAVLAYKKAIALDNTNPWTFYGLSNCYYQLGEISKVLPNMKDYLKTNSESLEYAFANALLLDKLNQTEHGLKLLANYKGQDQSVDETIERFTESINITKANNLASKGNIREAIEVLKDAKSAYALSTRGLLYDESGDKVRAISFLQRAVNLDATLTYAQLRLAQIYQELGQNSKAYTKALYLKKHKEDLSIDNLRALGDLFIALKDKQNALEIYDFALSTKDNAMTLNAANVGPNNQEQSPLNTKAWIARNKAQLQEQTSSTKKELIETYRRSLEIINKASPNTYNDNETYTRALRTPDIRQDWLTQSIRSNADRTYQNNNIVINGGFRQIRDTGHGGYSDNKGYLGLINVEIPMFNGKLTIQQDTTHLDAGKMTGGEYNDMFGTCFSTGCDNTQKHKRTFTSQAIGFDNDVLHLDIGNAPKISGNKRKNTGIVAGASYKFDAGNWTFTPEIHRRSKDNSLLSYFGDKDPNSGNYFGTVVKTGTQVTASYYINDRQGIWMNANFDMLKGKNVVNNTNIGAMGGYYFHWIDEPNERLTLSPSIMLMKYSKDLSGYTFGQGGYYSPQKYISTSLSLRYTRRYDNTSYMIELSGSATHSKTKAIDRYPIKRPLNNIYDIDASSESESTTSFGGGIIASVEQRITSNLVIGATVQAIKAQDYSPINGILFFRYYINDWRGDLYMPPKAPTPYVAW